MKHFSMKSTMLVLCGVLLFACNNEDFLEKTEGGTPCDYICFGVSPDESAQTKANQQDGANAYTAGRMVLRAANSKDTLCVRTIISDGIQTTGNKAVTRGTPVTTEAFHDNFHVLTVRDQETSFFMDEDVTNTNGSWTMDNTYYWPGEDHSLQFYAWAPKDAFTSTTASPENLTFNYTVPEKATEQQDLVVASIEHPGNYNQAVNLPFKHICTAIKFVVGDEMQPGTIKSVSLEGVKYAGSYDMTIGQWSLTGDSKSFTQTLDKGMTGGETEGSEITATGGTFMMLPQTLPADASVEVVFHSNATNTDRILSAPIGGTEWPEGKTLTYKLSITPEYEFKLEDENKVLDAHYEIFYTTLKVTGLSADQTWEIEGPNLGMNVTIQAQSAVNDYVKQGFWTDRNYNSNGTDTGSARGEKTYTGKGNGEFPIVIFVPENIGDATRDVVLKTKVNGQEVGEIILKQLAPNWFKDGLGCERIEGAEMPWGFGWSSDFKYVYNIESCDYIDRGILGLYIDFVKGMRRLAEGGGFLGNIIIDIYGGLENIPDLSFVTTSDDWVSCPKTITIDLGSLNANNIATSMDNGQLNTVEIYNFKGIQLVTGIIYRIESLSGYTESCKQIVGEGSNPTQNAAIACMKLNCWNLYKVSTDDNYLLKLHGDDTHPEWYLPAANEITGLTEDAEYPLKAEYWTSTAEMGNNTEAYKYPVDGQVIKELRKTEHPVRAVCKKP